jgi:hypothetical protein
MAKFDRLVITGEQREKIDMHALARVILRLARLRLCQAEAQQDKSGKAAP